MLASPVTFTDNSIFTIAEEFIQQTSRCIFLTGKAGTGKTTFLKHIKECTTKNVVVVAPTGVAAVHAGGTTIHSFFQLPFTPFVPHIAIQGGESTDQYQLIKNLKIDSEKRALFNVLELLIIDEVSMVRADVLDAIDCVLRHVRGRPHHAFGGVQVLFIGDLFQLPPVVPDDQWRILSSHYRSPFFFHARVIAYAKPLYLELKHIYRQRDLEFINVLNKVRNNIVEDADLNLLNQRYDPTFTPSLKTRYITLTTHNAKADKINIDELNKLSGVACTYEGAIEGDFPERAYPTDRTLRLKIGAQVMFIKNDLERVRRYYNGKIGVVKHIENEKIVVVFPNEDGEIEVEKDTWKNIQYSINPTTRQVEEKQVGTFSQYAIRLAWAITIHKSQGLTFDHVVLDAGFSFAPGQVYVALSRCRTLEGIVLHSKLSRNSIITDSQVFQYSREETSLEALPEILEEEKNNYHIAVLQDIFDWRKLVDEIEIFSAFLQEKNFKKKERAQQLLQLIAENNREHQHAAIKFQQQIERLKSDKNYSFLEERITAACTYFLPSLAKDMALLEEHYIEMKGEKRVKKYKQELKLLIAFIKEFIDCVEKAKKIATKLTS